MSKKTVVIGSSMFADPLHIGHIEYLEKAKTLGDKLIVIVNNDQQTVLKKGFCFQSCAERMKIIAALRCVDEVVESIDTDRTVCKTLAIIKPDVFAKGGDRTALEIPEREICNQLGIRIVDGLGEKIQSSSTLIANAASHAKSKIK